MTSDSCGCFFPSFPILLHLIIADMVVIVQKVFQVIAIVGKSGFVSHKKHTAETTNMDLFHS